MLAPTGEQIVVQPVEGPDMLNAGTNYPYMQPRVYNIPSEDETPISGPISGD